MPAAVPIALAGVGTWGANILRDLRTLGCDVWAVARSPESVERARAGGAAGIVGSVAELPPVRGAVVATPVGTHADVVEEFRSAQDVPVAVEKPLTDDAASAERLADRHGGRLFVLDKWRYHPGVLELARIARSGELGAVASLHMRRVSQGHRRTDVDPVWVLLPHDLAIALEVLGEVPPGVHAVAEVARGERIGLHATLGGPPWVTVEVSSAGPAHRRELRLVCEQGTAQIDGGWSEELAILRRPVGGGPPEKRPIPGELPLLAELRAFVEHLQGGPEPRSSAAEGAEIVRRVVELGELAERTLEEARA